MRKFLLSAISFRSIVIRKISHVFEGANRTFVFCPIRFKSESFCENRARIKKERPKQRERSRSRNRTIKNAEQT